MCQLARRCQAGVGYEVRLLRRRLCVGCSAFTSLLTHRTLVLSRCKLPPPSLIASVRRAPCAGLSSMLSAPARQDRIHSATSCACARKHSLCRLPRPDLTLTATLGPLSSLLSKPPSRLIGTLALASFLLSLTHLCVACSICRQIAVCEALGVFEYEAQPPTTTNNRICQAIRQCRNGVEFELQAPTSTTDRLCQAYTVCTSMQYQTQAPTTTSDRGLFRLCLCLYQLTAHIAIVTLRLHGPYSMRRSA